MTDRKSFQWMILWSALIVAALFAAAQQAWADEPRIALTVNGEKEVAQIRNGKKTVSKAPMDKIKSGDILVYTITYHNTGKSVARDVTVVDPVPANTVYLPGSAAGKDTKILFSINGGTTYHEPPVMRKSLDTAGREITAPAPPELYTHIQWIVKTPVAPNATGTVTFKVKVK
ncbi:MAG: hypothetical protein PHI35_09525 [Victivallaceae bacterium]|nr:hypothetical protein [Victivallaceae bacterium]